MPYSKEQIKNADWKRLSKVKELKDATLWGTSGILPGDINQGPVGTCWFLAAAACLADKHTDAIKQVFETDKVKGGYAVNLFALGVPQTTAIDDYIPFIDGKPMSVQISEDKSLWPMLLEKALAKMQGNYYTIAGSWAGWGVRHIYGTPREW